MVVLCILTLRSFVENRNLVRQTPYELVNKTTDLVSRAIGTAEDQLTFVGSYIWATRDTDRTAYTRSFFANRPSVLGISVYNAGLTSVYKNYRMSDDVLTEGLQTAEEYIAQKALQEKRTIVVDPAEIGGRTVMVIAAPLTADVDDIAGVIVGYIDTQMLWEGIPSVITSDNQQVMIIDRDTKILASSHVHDQMVLKNASLGSVINKNADRIFNLKFGGNYYIAVARPLENTNWSVVGLVNTRTLYTSFANNFLLGLTCLVLLLTIFSYEIMMLGRYLIKPLRSIVDNLSSIEKGNLQIQLGETRTVEFQAIVQVFNKMATSLYSSYSSLEQKVAEKTRELTDTLGRVEVLNKQLLRQKANDDALISSLGDLMCVVDPNNMIVRSNKKFNELFGVFQGGDFTQLFTVLKQDDPNFSLSGLVAAQNKFSYYSLEHPLVLQGKNVTMHIALSAAPIIALGEYLGMVFLMNDVTVEAQTEQKKGEFFMFASHQLRTPMTAIRWASESLLEKPIDEEVKKQITMIHDTNQGMIDMVNMLLNISKLELGVLALDTKEVKLEELRTTLINESQAMINEKQLTVEVGTPSTAVVKTDEKMLKLILQNLISNAIKYSPLGSTIGIFIDETPKGAVFSVRDSGPGIPDAEQGNIFQKFYRASNVKDTYSGSGLGLYMSKQIADALNVGLSFSTRNNGYGDAGTTFSLLFPMK